LCFSDVIARNKQWIECFW